MKTKYKILIALAIMIVLGSTYEYLSREPVPMEEIKEVPVEEKVSEIEEPKAERFFIDVFQGHVESNIKSGVPIEVNNYRDRNVLIKIRGMEIGEDFKDFQRISDSQAGIAILLEHKRDESKTWAREAKTSGVIQLEGSPTGRYMMFESYSKMRKELGG